MLPAITAGICCIIFILFHDTEKRASSLLRNEPGARFFIEMFCINAKSVFLKPPFHL